MFLFLHIHPRVCMFFVNHLQCSGHSLNGRWGCESLVNPVVMKPPERKSRGQSSLSVPPGPHIWAQWELGTVSYKFGRKGSRPWWGRWVPGHEPLLTAVSLFPLMSWGQWSFWDTPQQAKSPGHSLESHRGTPPPTPQLRDPAQPQSSGCPALNITQTASCSRGRHTLPQIGEIDFASGWFLLTQHKGRCLLFPGHR